MGKQQGLVPILILTLPSSEINASLSEARALSLWPYPPADCEPPEPSAVCAWLLEGEFPICFPFAVCQAFVYSDVHILSTFTYVPDLQLLKKKKPLLKTDGVCDDVILSSILCELCPAGTLQWVATTLLTSYV